MRRSDTHRLNIASKSIRRIPVAGARPRTNHAISLGQHHFYSCGGPLLTVAPVLLPSGPPAHTPKGQFHALRRMSATHIGAHRTRQWNERWCSAWTHPGAYFVSFLITNFQAATTIGLRDRRFSLHPTVVLNAFLWSKWPADDAAGGNSTWLGNKMRVIGAVGEFGRHLWPLVNIGGGGGGQMMLVAGREKVHFHGMPDRITSSDKTRRTGLQKVWIVQKIRLNVHEISNNDLEIIKKTFNGLQVGAVHA